MSWGLLGCECRRGDGAIDGFFGRSCRCVTECLAQFQNHVNVSRGV